MDEDIDLRRLRRVAVVGLAARATAAGGAIARLAAWDDGERGAGMAPPEAWVPSPRLETQPRDALRRYLDEKHAMLAGHAWVDPAAGIARIPIEQAMRAMTAPPESGAARAASADEPPPTTSPSSPDVPGALQ